MTGSSAASDWALWLGVASALSTLGIIGYSRLGAKGVGKTASIGTQTDSVSSLSGPSLSARKGDIFFGPRITPVPAGRRIWRKVALPSTADAASQTTATGTGIDAATQTQRITFSDANTFISPQSSISSTASTASNSSIGSFRLEQLFVEPVTIPASPGKIGGGTILGYIHDPLNNTWVPTGKSTYNPVR